MKINPRQAILIAGIVVLLSTNVGSWGMERDRISICSYAPPVALVVTDSQGHRAGVDLSKPLSTIGMGDEISEIPGAYVDQQNIGNDDPSSTEWMPTAWDVMIADGGDQTYRATLYGLQLAVVDVDVDAGRPRELMIRPFTTKVFVDKGVTKQLKVVFSPSRNFELMVERIVANDEISRDVGLACKLGLINPGGICRSLKAKAGTASKALEQHNKNAAKGAINAFLNELKAQGGKHVKEPALTILREEAEALLKSIGEGGGAVEMGEPAKTSAKAAKKKSWWWPF